MEQQGRATRRRQSRWWVSIVALVVWVLSFPPLLLATHEADHRFTVQGFVCGKDGKPAPNLEVLVKDTRVSVGQTVSTDEEGYYKVTLHLHNDNVGDPLLVAVGSDEQDHKVQFDPKDIETERKIQVNFGNGCEHELGTPRWVYYALGSGALAIGGLVGIRIFRSWRKQEQKRGKRQGKGKK